MDPGLTGKARRGLAVLTCIDSRIDPLAALGLTPGDAKIIRNVGASARVIAESLITLILAVDAALRRDLLGLRTSLFLPGASSVLCTGWGRS